MHRAAVDSHADFDSFVSPQETCDLHRAMHRRLRTIEENQGHAVPGWYANESVSRLGRPKMRRLPHKPIELGDNLTLLVDQLGRIADDVDKENVGDLQFATSGEIVSHVPLKNRSTGSTVVTTQARSGSNVRRARAD